MSKTGWLAITTITFIFLVIVYVGLDKKEEKPAEPKSQCYNTLHCGRAWKVIDMLKAIPVDEWYTSEEHDERCVITKIAKSVHWSEYIHICDSGVARYAGVWGSQAKKKKLSRCCGEEIKDLFSYIYEQLEDKELESLLPD